MRLATIVLTLFLALGILPAQSAEKKKAGPANIVGAAVTRNLDGSFDIRVTVRSADKGPEYFCDRIEFLGPDGKVVHTHRVPRPHLNEQPFSETLNSLKLPAELETVTVRARMRPDGAAGKERIVKLPQQKKK